MDTGVCVGEATGVDGEVLGTGADGAVVGTGVDDPWDLGVDDPLDLGVDDPVEEAGVVDVKAVPGAAPMERVRAAPPISPETRSDRRPPPGMLELYKSRTYRLQLVKLAKGVSGRRGLRLTLTLEEASRPRLGFSGMMSSG